jgi:hypothetical protein
MLKLSPAPVFLWLVAMQAAHSVEECLTGFWKWFPVLTAGIHRLMDFFPIITPSRGQFIAVNFVIVIALSAVGAFSFRRRRWALRAALVIAIAEVINGIYHVGATVFLGYYFPGAVSGVGLIIIGSLYLMARATGNGTSTAHTSMP